MSRLLLSLSIVAKLQFSDLIVPIAELAWKGLKRKELAKRLPGSAMIGWLFSEEGYPLKQQIAPATRGVSYVEELVSWYNLMYFLLGLPDIQGKTVPLPESGVVGMLQGMIDCLVADFGFEHVKTAGEAHFDRTTEPVVRFLVWLEKTPEAQASLRIAFRRLAGNFLLGKSRNTL